MLFLEDKAVALLIVYRHSSAALIEVEVMPPSCFPLNSAVLLVGQKNRRNSRLHFLIIISLLIISCFNGDKGTNLVLVTISHYITILLYFISRSSSCEGKAAEAKVKTMNAGMQRIKSKAEV